MDFAEQIRILEAAKGDPALLYLASVDLTLPALTAAERARVKEALIAAAIPHWCDRGFLAALLSATSEESERLLGWLCSLKIIEPFPARGEAAINVHETARLTLREHLRITRPDLWKCYAQRARDHLATGTETHLRIETLYHQFAADADAAVVQCEALDRDFRQHPATESALCIALTELTTAGWLTGAALVEALRAPLWYRSSRGEVSQLESESKTLLSIALSHSHPSRIADAHGLVGDVYVSHGDLAAALPYFTETQTILERLVAGAPSNSGWQRELGVAHSRVGGIYQEQGKLDDALTAFREDLTISKKLSEQDPSNAVWQRDLALTHYRLAVVLQKNGEEGKAESSYRWAIKTMERAVAMSPGNVGWKQELARWKRAAGGR